MSLAQMVAVKRPHPVAFSVFLVVAWLLLALLALGLRRGPIEDELSDRAVLAVRSHGQTGAQVSFDGRDATVHGTFPSVADAETARQVVARVSGARSVSLGSDIHIVPAVLPGVVAKPFVIAVDGGSLTVTATVPDRAAREQLLGAAAAASSAILTGKVTVDPDSAAPPVTALADLTRTLTAVAGEHKVTITGSSMVVEGSVGDTDEATRLGSDLLAGARKTQPAATLDNRLTVRSVASALPPVGEGVAQLATGRLVGAVAEGRITFETNSSELTEADRVHLDRIAAVLRESELSVLLAGHTDTRGPRAVNEALSLLRAQTAAGYLSDRGVPAEHLRAAGFAWDHPVATNDTEAGRAANRRVEISALVP
ncbi:OmpA/MotB domain-containing protein [Candidatus Protofrankia californiensis]|uniref:OmpA/MotB domain-containing protein n=2 Tax=Protofrankia TaxID=2994361 RepID=A0A1C3P6Z1_9ACTN|nr:OmpA/MotB domain-containing protein [Candidatus Protofrankia californiensis]